MCAAGLTDLQSRLCDAVCVRARTCLELTDLTLTLVEGSGLVCWRVRGDGCFCLCCFCWVVVVRGVAIVLPSLLTSPVLLVLQPQAVEGAFDPYSDIMRASSPRPGLFFLVMSGAKHDTLQPKR